MRWDELCMEKVPCLLKEGSGVEEIISMTKKTWPQGLFMSIGNLSVLETGVFLCSNCCVIPSLVSISCLFPRKWPVVAGVQRLVSFCRVASECYCAGFVL